MSVSLKKRGITIKSFFHLVGEHCYVNKSLANTESTYYTLMRVINKDMEIPVHAEQMKWLFEGEVKKTQIEGKIVRRKILGLAEDLRVNDRPEDYRTCYSKEELKGMIAGEVGHGFYPDPKQLAFLQRGWRRKDRIEEIQTGECKKILGDGIVEGEPEVGWIFNGFFKGATPRYTTEEVVA